MVLRHVFPALLLGLSAVMPPPQEAAPPAPALSDQQIEDFLAHARVVRTRTISKGVTGTIRATLSDGRITHDAQIQQVDVQMARFTTPRGTETDFRDSWSYNVAAYRLDRLLGFNLVPVSVSREWRGKPSAFTWWIDDVMMDEQERLRTKTSPPDPERWNQQMQLLRLFDQLIGNSDRNLGNVLVTRDWRIWAIDHTRAFRLNPGPSVPGNISRCDRRVLERLKTVSDAEMQSAVRGLFYTTEMSPLLSRRGAIVALFERAGPGALFDR